MSKPLALIGDVSIAAFVPGRASYTCFVKMICGIPASEASDSLSHSTMEGSTSMAGHKGPASAPISTSQRRARIQLVAGSNRASRHPNKLPAFGAVKRKFSCKFSSCHRTRASLSA